MNADHVGQVAIVTGGAKGIGLASAARLKDAGFRLALVDVSEHHLAAAADVLGAAPERIRTIPIDVRSHDGARQAVDALLCAWGRIDVLVNSAGISQPKTLLDISEAEWDLVIDVNLKGTFNWCKAVAASMVAAGKGRIVNISSVNANTGGSASAVSKFAYAASKAGVLGLTRGIAKELAPHVTVNAICPGLIATGLTEGMIARQGGGTISRTIPLGRIGTPDDVAVIVHFLATVEPNYLTGEVIDVDGGAFVN